jgi:hypothetical protein
MRFFVTPLTSNPLRRNGFKARKSAKVLKVSESTELQQPAPLDAGGRCEL